MNKKVFAVVLLLSFFTLAHKSQAIIVAPFFNINVHEHALGGESTFSFHVTGVDSSNWVSYHVADFSIDTIAGEGSYSTGSVSSNSTIFSIRQDQVPDWLSPVVTCISNNPLVTTFPVDNGVDIHGQPYSSIDCDVTNTRKSVPTPPTLSAIGQFKSDGFTSITEGATTTEPILIFYAQLASANNNQGKLQVELKEVNQPFDETNLLESGFVSSGSIATTTIYSLTDDSYHWRVRAVDDKGLISDWQEFGIAGNTDFIVRLPLNIKAAESAMQLVRQNYLWGGKGWDFANNLFTDTNTVKTGYQYWNPTTKSVATGNGVDCSGLVMWAYDRNFDPLKPHLQNFVKYESADGQYRYNTQPVTRPQLQPGDEMFFSHTTNSDGSKHVDHVAMYVGNQGNFEIVEARSPRIGIATTTMASAEARGGFVAFGNPSNPLVAMAVTGHSPINLAVTDPAGNTINSDTVISSEEEYLHEIPGELYYSEMEKSTDGNPMSVVYSPLLKQGAYRINITPMVGSTPNQTYSLDFTTGSTIIALAQNVPLSQIPQNGYGVVVAADNTVTLDDMVPPEARVSFSTSTQKLLIEGIDDTTTTISTTATSTLITDQAGNTLQVTRSRDSQEKREINLEIKRLLYNGVLSNNFKKTTLQYEWSVGKNGSIKEFEQKATAGNIEVQGHYNAEKNTTEISKRVRSHEDDGHHGEHDLQKEATIILPGLVIINITTDKGSSEIKY